jgi:ElaB/YqjD/DUF883 family membrane-anchored ribosome-binding protein
MSIILNIVTDANLKGIKKAIKEFDSLKTAGEKASFAISKAAVPAGLAVAGLAAAGLAAARAAGDEQLAMQKLATQLVNSTNATTAQIAANEEWISGLQYTAAVSDDQLRPALSSLVVATKDLGTAQRLLGVALNVSAATGRDLGSVSEALSRGFSGNMRALSTLSPELKTAIKNGADFSDVLVILEKNFKGSAEAAADTAAGGITKMQIAMDDAQETLGIALIPYLTAFAEVLTSASKWVKENTTLAIGFGTAIGGLGAALVITRGAMLAYKTMAVITTAVNTALATSGFAVQISTGVGIAAAIAGAAALGVIATKISNATQINERYTNSLDTMSRAWQNLMDPVGRGMRDLNAVIAMVQAEEEAAAERAATAAKKASDAAKRLFDSTKKAIKEAKKVLQEYATELADQVRSWISLSNAVSSATDSETTYQDALRERAAAYEELNKLQAKGLYTTEEMATATDRLAKAETGLASAQSSRTNYSQQFAEQIAAAKKFGGQLQQLIAAGLGRSGLAQIMNLGPVAGSQVAADILAGTGGMSVASLNQDLAVIDQAGTALGGAAIAGDMSLLNQAQATRTGNTVNITVTSADPNAVVAALQKYVRTSGPVPIRIRNP